MARYGWNDYPEAVRGQVQEFVGAVKEVLGPDLIGVYLHGSLAMGCFNPERSDVDLLVVTGMGMSLETKYNIGKILLRCSKAPAPIEISFLRMGDLHPWKYPTPFDLHYSEDWRVKYEHELAGGAWRQWNDEAPKDADLAAHITVALNRGVSLHGKPVAEVFPPVPAEHYRASILEDFYWGRERLAENPVYFILNACRIWAYLRDGCVYSKDEGGEWALQALPEEFQGIIRQAREFYGGSLEEENFEESSLSKFTGYMADIIGWDYSKTWYHGSPMELAVLLKGSTITQKRDLARVFSHKPGLVSFSEEGSMIGHTGTLPGFLYRIADEVRLGDVCPHPRTVMSFGDEWLTGRALRLELIGPTQVVEEERLTEEQVEALMRAMRENHDLLQS